jgi:hypothetical protein
MSDQNSWLRIPQHGGGHLGRIVSGIAFGEEVACRDVILSGPTGVFHDRDHIVGYWRRATVLVQPEMARGRFPLS